MECANPLRDSESNFNFPCRRNPGTTTTTVPCDNNKSSSKAKCYRKLSYHNKSTNNHTLSYTHYLKSPGIRLGFHARASWWMFIFTLMLILPLSIHANIPVD